MKNKHPHAVAVLVLGLAMAGLHLADLLLWSEADTGFAAAGSVWLRYIPWLAAFALPYLPARRAAAQPAGLQDTNKPLGVCMALTGAALLASGVAAGNTARYAILYPEVLSGSCPVWAAWADLLLPIFAGAWLLNYAVRAFSGFGLQRQRLGSSLLAGAVPLVFLWRLIWRFQFAPASLCRMPCTLRVLSAAAALLLAVVLIKIFLVPGLPCGHTLYAAGTGAFLLCTGLELPQTLFEATRGMLTLPDLLTGIGIGLFGLCGLCVGGVRERDGIRQKKTLPLAGGEKAPPAVVVARPAPRTGELAEPARSEGLFPLPGRNCFYSSSSTQSPSRYTFAAL